MGFDLQGNLVVECDVFPAVLGLRTGNPPFIPELGSRFFESARRPIVAAWNNAQAPVLTRSPGEVVHELRPPRTPVDVPPHRSVRGLLIDTAIAHIDIAVPSQLAAELDDFRMQDDLHERQGVIEEAPVRVC